MFSVQMVWNYVTAWRSSEPPKSKVTLTRTRGAAQRSRILAEHWNRGHCNDAQSCSWSWLQSIVQSKSKERGARRTRAPRKTSATTCVEYPNASFMQSSFDDVPAHWLPEPDRSVCSLGCGSLIRSHHGQVPSGAVTEIDRSTAGARQPAHGHGSSAPRSVGTTRR